jgi:hypothetical protein
LSTKNDDEILGSSFQAISVKKKIFEPDGRIRKNKKCLF